MQLKDAEIINIDNDLENAVKKAAKLYLEGAVFVYPTDTVYGFGANPFNRDAVSKIDDIKGRAEGKGYIMLCDSIDTLLKYIKPDDENHIDFLISIWPNPVSVVLKLNEKAARLLGYDTAAFRIPNNRFCKKMLSELKMPVVSTSVNRSGKASLVEHSTIRDEFSAEIDAIFYTEKKTYPVESTLIDLSNGNLKLLREGKIKFDDLQQKFK